MAKKRKNGRFASLPHNILNCPDYIALTSIAKSLLIELIMQYDGSNNGDLTLAWSVMHKRGFKAESTIIRGKKNLLERKMVTEVRKGIAKKGVRLCSLYALNWLRVDEVYYPDGLPKYQLPTTKGPLRTEWRKSLLMDK